jgi:hypothetical protein
MNYKATRFSHIYKTEYSYRVRLMRNGKKFSFYCKKQREALNFRNSILNQESN